MFFRKHHFIPILLVVCALSLTGCRKTVLLQDLDQKDLNEVMVLLNKNGIEAEKMVVEKQQQVTWSVTVAPGDQERARELLVANHLPRQKEMGLSGVCKDAGLIPTPKTEKCRELLAMKGEIINSLVSIPGVVNADVVLNIPDKEDFPNADTEQKRPAASVTLQVGRAANITDVVTEAKIQQFVANAVTGMDMRDVAVIISPIDGAPEEHANSPVETVVATTTPSAETVTPVLSGDSVELGGMTMDADSAKKFKVMASLFLFFFVVLSGSLIFVLLKLARVRQGTSHALVPAPQIPEKIQMDQLVQETGEKQKIKA